MRSGNLRRTGDQMRSAAALHDVHRGEADEDVDRRVRRGDHHLGRRTDVHAHDDVLVAARLPERIPVIRVDARPAELGGVLREGHRVSALGRAASDLGGQDLGVPDGRDRAGDEAARVGAAPLVDVPVVVGPDHGQRHVLVLGAGEELAAELGEGGEAQRAEHAVGVHVLDPLVDVPAARAGSRRTRWAPCRTPRAAARPRR